MSVLSPPMNLGGGSLASRRGGPAMKPLSFEKFPEQGDGETVATPRTSRSHMLAGLRTAKSTAAPSTATTPAPGLSRSVNSTPGSNGRVSPPQAASYGMMNELTPQYTPDQVLAPPEILIDDQSAEPYDPNLYAQLVATNMYLAQQRQRLQQQLLDVQAAAQQFQGMNLNGNYMGQQQYGHQRQSSMGYTPQQAVYAYVDPATGQTQYYVDQQQQYMQQLEQAQFAMMQQQQQMQMAMMQQQQQQQQQQSRLFVNSPAEGKSRNSSPISRHTASPESVSSDFRRNHKKATSMAIKTGSQTSSPEIEVPMSAGPRTTTFGAVGFGPGQARAGEHPTRQPRNPPPIEELRAKPTSKHEGSKNFALRTRRSALTNLVRAGKVRRQGTTSSSSSVTSPVSSAGESIGTPNTALFGERDKF